MSLAGIFILLLIKAKYALLIALHIIKYYYNPIMLKKLINQ